jgi:hypothetical protein
MDKNLYHDKCWMTALSMQTTETACACGSNQRKISHERCRCCAKRDAVCEFCGERLKPRAS